MPPSRGTARLAGALYLALMPFGFFGIIYVPSVLVVPGDAATTSRNIMASEWMFRSATVSHLISQVIFIFLVLALLVILQFWWAFLSARTSRGVESLWGRQSMYEHRTDRLLPWAHFVRRAWRHALWASLGLLVVVGGGTVGYRTVAGLNWIDAFLNASMILSGMGPVDRMNTAAAKLFAALYALFSGLVFIAVVGVVLAPWMHRLVHRVHLDEE